MLIYRTFTTSSQLEESRFRRGLHYPPRFLTILLKKPHTIECKTSKKYYSNINISRYNLHTQYLYVLIYISTSKIIEIFINITLRYYFLFRYLFPNIPTHNIHVILHMMAADQLLWTRLYSLSEANMSEQCDVKWTIFSYQKVDGASIEIFHSERLRHKMLLPILLHLYMELDEFPYWIIWGVRHHPR